MPARPHPGSRRAWGAVWGICIFLFAEIVGLRDGRLWLLIEHSPAFGELPAVGAQPSSFISNLALASRARHAEVLRDGILVVGSSAAPFGVDEALLAELTGRPVEILWEGGADFPTVEAMTSLVLPELHPRVVLLAATPHQALETSDRSDLARRRRYQIPPPAGAREWTDVSLQRALEFYRFRGPLRHFLDLRAQRLGRELAGVAGPPAPPFEWPHGPDTQMGIARAAWERSGSVEHYWKSIEHAALGAGTVYAFATRYRSDFRRRGDPQWTAVERWVARVRAHGAVPAIALFPLNPMVRRQDFGNVVVPPQLSPVLPAPVGEAFVADITALADEHDVPLLNALDTMGPEAFYDFHHLMRAPRRQFTRVVAAWLHRIEPHPARAPAPDA